MATTSETLAIAAMKKAKRDQAVAEGEGKIVRFTWLCIFLIIGLVAGDYFLYAVVGLVGTPLVRANILSAIAVILVAAPLITFLTKQWYVRRNEFRNRLSDGALLFYLERYWSRRAQANKIIFPGQANAENADNKRLAETLFTNIYDEQYGLKAFLTPCALVILATFANAALVSWLWGCTRTFGAHADQCSIFGALPNLATGAIAGAYMFAVGDCVNSVRQNSLNVADVYWYALRLIIAIPLGVAVGNVTGSPTDAHTLVAFGLGALPVEEIQKQLRRLTMGQLQAGDARQESDQLVSLEGVTVRISALLAAEGISSVAQLVTRDPVLLAVRTGLEFDFVLYLASQAVVRRHLGSGAAALVALGLIEAQAFLPLVEMLGDKSDDATKAVGEQQLKDAVSRLKTEVFKLDNASTSPGDEIVLAAFKQIAGASYTAFLVKVAPHGYAARAS
jgi:hypothetical protein